MPGVDLVEPAEVLGVGVEDRRLDDVLHGRPGGDEHGGKAEQRPLGLGFDPLGIVPLAGSVPAIPEQKTSPPATIAWL
jgi:hypothetical protein